MRVGIFGGTFDPPHYGHISVAVNLKEAHGLDRVLFIPANSNPQKTVMPIASGDDRLRMLKLTISGIPGFAMTNMEVRREGPSYMIDTIHELKLTGRYRGAEFFLLMGEDLVGDLLHWKQAYELIQEAPPLIARRLGHDSLAQIQDAAFSTEFAGVIARGVTETPLLDISSTDIRRRVQAGLFCGHLVDRRVLRYIEKHNLYYC